ncbi:unnamed protein product [Larinioides sclopetarius]|uniref:Uncharacterized protein n=1 Tax=Larinioides sclopetarius TaxID=280406 RepID=A0AAV1ZZV7_9ARAC
MKKKPSLEPQLKSPRMCTKTHMSYGVKFKSVISSDEKKWNLDRPD